MQADIETSPTIDRLTRSWTLSMRAANKAERTVGGYRESVDLFVRYLEQQGMPTRVAAITREHVESFVVDQLARNKPSTAVTRYKGVKSFLTWCVEEGEIVDHPMRNMRSPAIPDTPIPVLTDDQVRAVLRACDGKTFNDRRDTAIFTVLYDTGIRRSELAALHLGHVDFDTQTLLVMGKGSRPRACPFGRRTAQALDRYLRSRDAHPLAQRRRRAPQRLLSTSVRYLTVRSAAPVGGASVEGIHLHPVAVLTRAPESPSHPLSTVNACPIRVE